MAAALLLVLCKDTVLAGWCVLLVVDACLFLLVASELSYNYHTIIIQFWLVYSLTVHRFMATAVWTGMAFGPTHRWYIDSWLLQMAVTGVIT